MGWTSRRLQAEMLNGIVAFEVNVTELQTTKKLSQNKTQVEQQRIINALSASSDGTERDLAAFMQVNLKHS